MTGTLVNDGATLLDPASKFDCAPGPLTARRCPNEPVRKVPRSFHEGARDMDRNIARSKEGKVPRRERKKVEMLFADLKRILKLDRPGYEVRTKRGKLAKLIPVLHPSPA